MNGRAGDETGENDPVMNSLKGGREDFKIIVDRYGAQIMALAMNVLMNREDAEDVLQESFLQAYRNRDRFDPKKSFKTWILTIAYRRCLDALKKKKRFASAVHRAGHEFSHFHLSPDSEPPRDKPLPSRLLTGLSAKERGALCLWANEGSTAKEISEVLNCSASTARVYLFNARKKIKTHWEKNNGSLQDD